MADLSIGTTIGGFAAYHAGNYFPDKTTVGLGSVNNWGASDSYTTASSTTYATSAAVKAAYDAAMAAVAALGSPAWGSITDKPSTFPATAHTHTAADITNLNNQDAAATANTLALRDASADISVRLLRANYADESNLTGAIAFRVNNATNNYTRYCNNPASVRTWLGAFSASAYNPRADSLNNSGGQIAVWTGDLNTLAAGVLVLAQKAGSTNYPSTGTYGYVETKTIYAAGALLQTFWPYDGVGEAYFRNYSLNSSTWTAWRRIFDTASPPTAAQVGAMADGGVYGTATFNNWIRTAGNTGWYNETYGGGMHMLDTSWVRVYNGKALYCAGEGAFAGNVTAYYSDERLKEVDEDLDPDQCLAAVNRWRKVRYHANDLGAQNGYDPKKREIGLLAGEVHQDFPELTPLAPFDFETLKDGTVISKSGENYRTMTYERVVAVQAAAITALTRRLEKLEAKQND